MSNPLAIFVKRAILIMAPFFFIACEKSTGEIGLNQVIDSQAVLGTKKSIPITTYNVAFDSVVSDGPSQEIAGAYIDPYFGGVDARFNSHIILSLLSPNFGTDPICDSVVMLLGYNGYYGDTAMPVTFVVKELSEYIDPDSTYYSNRVFAVDKEIGRITQNPRPRTVVYYQGDTLSPALKMQLDKQFFQDKIIDGAVTNSASFTDNDEFIKYFNGIQLSVDGYSDGLLYFNTGSLSSKIVVYYRESPADTVSEIYTMDYGVPTSTAYTTINSFAQDFTLGGPNLGMQDTVNGEETLLSQSMGGVVPRIVLPNLKEYKDSNWIINRAEIVFHVREGSVGKYSLPGSIIILEEKDDRRVLIDDYASNGISADGNLVVGELRGKTYTFNITRLANRYMSTTDEIKPLILLPGSSASRGWRAVLNGNKDAVSPVAFNIYYTKTKE